MKAKRFKILVSVVVSILIVGGFLPFIELSTFELLDQKEIIVNAYDDSGTGGNSNSLVERKSNGGICLNYTINESDVYQYAGYKITRTNKTGFDFSNFNQVEFVAVGNVKKRLNVFLVTQLADSSLGKMPKRNIIELEESKRSVLLSFSDFVTPVWWFTKNKITQKEAPSFDFNSVHSVNIEHDVLQQLGVEDSFCFTSIKFSKNNSTVYWSCIQVLILFHAIFWLGFFLVSRKKELVIQYKAQEVEEIDHSKIKDQNLQNVVDFIGANYADPELKLLKIRKALGLTEATISSLIKENFDLSYTNYLQQIRIAEAKRLLKENNLNINEVAFKVGFGHISSFNRVFKNIVGETPGDFLKSCK